jgi:hypothetical protein
LGHAANRIPPYLIHDEIARPTSYQCHRRDTLYDAVCSTTPRYHTNVRDKPSSVGHKWPSPRNPRFESTSGAFYLGCGWNVPHPTVPVQGRPCKSVNPTLLPLVTELIASRSSGSALQHGPQCVTHAPVVEFSQFDHVVLTGSLSHFSNHTIDTLGRSIRAPRKALRYVGACLFVSFSSNRPNHLRNKLLAVAK